MQLDAKLSSYDMDNLITAITADLTNGIITATKDKCAIKYGGSEKLPSSLQTAVERLLNAAFKEGCKCGKGGFSPY
jgi:hypothetical protein